MYPTNAKRHTKVCTSCRREKDIDSFYFKNRLTGQRYSRCIVCMSRSNQPREVAPGPLTKTCTKCLIEKPVEEFPFKNTERGKRLGFANSAPQNVRKMRTMATMRESLSERQRRAVGSNGSPVSGDIIRIMRSYLNRIEGMPPEHEVESSSLSERTSKT